LPSMMIPMWRGTCESKVEGKRTDPTENRLGAGWPGRPSSSRPRPTSRLAARHLWWKAT